MSNLLVIVFLTFIGIGLVWCIGNIIRISIDQTRNEILSELADLIEKKVGVSRDEAYAMAKEVNSANRKTIVNKLKKHKSYEG